MFIPLKITSYVQSFLLKYFIVYDVTLYENSLEKVARLLLTYQKGYTSFRLSLYIISRPAPSIPCDYTHR